MRVGKQMLPKSGEYYKQSAYSKSTSPGQLHVRWIPPKNQEMESEDQPERSSKYKHSIEPRIDDPGVWFDFGTVFDLGCAFSLLFVV